MNSVWELFLVVNLAMNGAILWKIYSIDIVQLEMYGAELPPMDKEDKDGQ